MKKICRFYFIIVLIPFLLNACSTTNDPAEAYKGQSPHEIFQRGKSELQDHNYSEALKRFEALDIQYPFGAETERAQLYLIYVYYMKEDYALSVAAADRFIRMHPTHPDVDYAFYMRGIANYYQNLGVIERLFTIDLAKRDLVQIRKSFNSFNELVTRFPNSRYTPSAHQYLVYLRNVLANHELQVGEYYYTRRAYIAAVNRASNVVAHYQGSPAVIPALVLMTKSYHQLGMSKLEQDTLRLLKFNYPDVQVRV